MTPRARSESPAPAGAPQAAALAGFAAVAAVASFLRVPELWGVGAAGEYGRVWLGVWGAAAVLALAPGADRRLARILDAIPERLLAFTVIAAAPGVCWWTRVQLPWLGDQLLWLRQIAAKSGFLHQIEPLPYALVDVSRNLLPPDPGGLPRGSALAVALLAPAWAFFTLRLAGEIAGADRARRRFLWFLLLAAPQGLLLHGYVESYGLLLVCLTAVAWLGCRALRTGRPGWLWPAFLGAVGSHLQALGGLVAMWSTARSRRARVWAAGGTVVVLAAAAGWYLFAGSRYQQQEKTLGETLVFLFPPGRLYDPFLGAHHLLGILNIVLLAGGPLLWAAPLLPWRRVWREDRARLVFLALLAAPGLGGIALVRLSLGALRDWDLFASYLFVLLPLLAWAWFARQPRGLPRYSAFLLVLAVGHGLAWTLVDTDRQRGFDRAARLYGGDRLFSPDARGLTGDELAYIERAAQHPEGAAAWYGRAAEANPTNWRFFHNQASMLVALGRTDEALEPLRTAVRHGPSIAEPYVTLGAILVNQGSAAEARDVAQRGLDRSGAQARLYFIRGVAEAQLQRPAPAAASLDTAATLAPRDEEIHRFAAQVAVDAGDPRRALRYLETLVTLNPAKPDYWRALGRSATAAGDTARARVALARYENLAREP